MKKDVFLVIRGVLNYTKLTGPARPHTGLAKYDKGPKWSVDIAPNAKSLADLKAAGLEGKLKTPKATDKGRAGSDQYITLSVLENRPDGSKNNPPSVKDVTGRVWDDREIGNGTIADVKVKVKDYGPGSEMGVYLQAVRILKLETYERVEFEELSEDDEFFAMAETGSDFDEPANQHGQDGEVPSVDEDLNDDVPY